MAKYRLSNAAKEDLIRKHQFGVSQFGLKQADKYFNTLFDYFETIAKNSFAFQSVNHIKTGYRRCVCRVHSIYYKVNGDIVDIMTIIGRRDLTNKL